MRYLNTAKTGMHVSMFSPREEGKDPYIPSFVRTERDGKYSITVFRDADAGTWYSKLVFDQPIEMEKDPMRRILRERKIPIFRDLIETISVRDDIPYEWTSVQAPEQLPAGARCLSFCGDGDAMRPVEYSYTDDNSPIFGAMTGGTFMIRYSTSVATDGKIERHIDRIVLRSRAVKPGSRARAQGADSRDIVLFDRPELVAEFKKALEAIGDPNTKPEGLLSFSRPEFKALDALQPNESEAADVSKQC